MGEARGSALGYGRGCCLGAGSPSSAAASSYPPAHPNASTPLTLPLQGIRWIINRESPSGLVVIQQSQPKYIDKVHGGTAMAGCRR